jgi:two-component system invasion response regulator UvrY
MEPAPTVRVLVVDDQQPFRLAARTLVSRTDGFTLVAEAGDGNAAVEAFHQHRPDLVLMDVNLPGRDGLSATQAIVAGHPGAVVVLVSSYEPDDLPEAARTCGAVGYLHKGELGPAALRQLWADHGPRRATGR